MACGAVETPREKKRHRDTDTHKKRHRKRETGRGAVRVGVDKVKTREDKEEKQGSNTAGEQHGSAAATTRTYPPPMYVAKKRFWSLSRPSGCTCSRRKRVKGDKERGKETEREGKEKER